MSALCALRTLRCAHCNFTQFPAGALAGLEVIEELDFSGCSKMVVQESVQTLVDLRRLQIFSVVGCLSSGHTTRAMLCLLNSLRSQEPNLRVLIEARGPDAKSLTDGERHTLRIHV